jgi:hypothetical protein
MRPLIFASALFLGVAAFLAASSMASDRIVGALFLLLMAGTVLVTLRLLLLRPEALVIAAGLGAFFIIGFAEALADGDRDWRGWGAATTALSFVLTVTTILVAGWLASARWAAPVACAVFIPLAWIVAVLGAYTAYATGWRGLEIDTFGSDDQPGLANSAWTFALYTPLWSIYAVIAAVVGWFVNTVRPRHAGPSPKTLEPADYPPADPGDALQSEGPQKDTALEEGASQTPPSRLRLLRPELP